LINDPGVKKMLNRFVEMILEKVEKQ